MNCKLVSSRKNTYAVLYKNFIHGKTLFISRFVFGRSRHKKIIRRGRRKFIEFHIGQFSHVRELSEFIFARAVNVMVINFGKPAPLARLDEYVYPKRPVE